MIIKSGGFNSHYLLIKCLLVIVLIEYSNGGNGKCLKMICKSESNSTRCLLLSFLLILRELRRCRKIPFRLEALQFNELAENCGKIVNGLLTVINV